MQIDPVAAEEGCCSHERFAISPVYQLSLGRQIAFPNYSEAQDQTHSIQTSAVPLVNFENWGSDPTSQEFSLFNCKMRVISMSKDCCEK